MQTNSGSSPVVGICRRAWRGSRARLAFEFIMECRRKKYLIIEARATAHESGNALFNLCLNWPDHSFRFSREKTSAEVCRARINSRLAGLGLIADGPIIMSSSASAITARSAGGSQLSIKNFSPCLERISTVVGQLIPAVILFEDLHWLDEASEAFVREIVRGLSS